jgi:ribosome assembly protein RRB1
MEVDQQTFIPGRHKLSQGEVLTPDPSTYEMLHTLSTTWPCLSFDIIRDNLGDQRKAFPATVYAVGGTQALDSRAKENELLVMKLSGLSRMEANKNDSDSDSDDNDDENEYSADPILENKSISLPAATNRIRAHQQPLNSSYPGTVHAACMLENGQVHIYDVTAQIASFDTPGTVITPEQKKPQSIVRSHGSVEGYGIDWSPLIPEGKLLTGDNRGRVYVTSHAEGGAWTTDSKPFTGHTGSVEDIQWSPVEKNVFATAGTDGTVRIWDLRAKNKTPAVTIKVSSADVNVISWSRQTAHLLASGDDLGVWSVWDLRSWKPTKNAAVSPTPKPVASFNFHKEQITSLEWHPTEDSIVAVAAGDNTLTLWDLAVELDDEESQDTGGVQDVPSQLLFVHYMDNVKECHWHPQIPGAVMGTGADGFGVFKTISV